MDTTSRTSEWRLRWKLFILFLHGWLCCDLLFLMMRLIFCKMQGRWIAFHQTSLVASYWHLMTRLTFALHARPLTMLFMRIQRSFGCKPVVFGFQRPCKIVLLSCLRNANCCSIWTSAKAMSPTWRPCPASLPFRHWFADPVHRSPTYRLCPASLPFRSWIVAVALELPIWHPCPASLPFCT